MKMTRKMRVLVIICLSILVGVSFFLNTAIVTAKYYEGRILPNTTVSGMSMSGKKVDEAASLISTQAGKITSQPVTLQLGDTTSTATSAELGVAIDETATLQQLSPSTDTWAWSKLSYWKSFFRNKNQVMVYSVNEEKLTDTLNTMFPVSQEAKDAEITIKDGQLETTLAQEGITVDIDLIKRNLQSLVASAAPPPPVTLDFSTAAPQVSTAQANQTKTEVETALKPIFLTENGKGYRIESKDYYSYITFTKHENSISWQITQSKLEELIKAKLSKKINIKMRQKTIMSDTGQVTDEGQEGKEIDAAALAATLFPMVRDRAYNTAETPVNVPVRVIPITDKVVTPAFVAGQYEGKYISINLSEQKIYLLEGKTLVGSYTVSSGKWSTPTPKGVFYIKNKISMAYSRPFKLYMPWWNALAPNPDGSGYKGVGIHGLPCFNKSCSSREGENHIGTPVSHGCVRVNDEGAQLIYDWAPVGTPVVIN